MNIGQDKFDVLDISNHKGQIGYFGIGILSVFLLADRFEVTTKSIRATNRAITFKVTGIDETVKFLQHNRQEPGTEIRVFPKNHDTLSSLPGAVESYARHVKGITIHSIDEKSLRPVGETWDIKNLLHVQSIDSIPKIRSGRIGFLPALREDSGTLENRITICNAGFLVEEAVSDLVSSTFGIGGEIDLEPSTVTIGMSRERIQRDNLWTQLGEQLQEVFIEAAISELETGSLQQGSGSESEKTKRNIMLWYRYLPPEPPFSRLYEMLDQRVFELILFNQQEKPPTTLASLTENYNQLGKLYFRQVGPIIQRTKTVDEDGLGIRFEQEIRDSVRISALRAKGFSVVDLDQFRVNIKSNSTVQTTSIQELELVQKCLQRRGIKLQNIVDAPESDMDMRSIEVLPILQSALTITGGLRFASVPDTRRRVISDQTGKRYVNLRSPSIQELLKTIPEATSNLLKHKLLEVFLNLEDYKFAEARSNLIGLLNSKDLGSLATTEMAPLTKKTLGFAY